MVIANEVNQELGIHEAELQEEKQTAADRILRLIGDAKEVSVQDVYEMLLKSGDEIARPTVNTTLHNLANRGVLVKLGRGVYGVNLL